MIIIAVQTHFGKIVVCWILFHSAFLTILISVAVFDLCGGWRVKVLFYFTHSSPKTLQLTLNWARIIGATYAVFSSRQTEGFQKPFNLS